MEAARSESLPGDSSPTPEDIESVEGFFDQEFFTGAEQPVVPQSPFDALFSGAQPPPGTEALHGLPSVQQFAPVNVVTLEQWLMANGPEARFSIHLYKEKLESIRDNRYQPWMNQLRELLANGGMQPQEIRATQEMVELLEEAILKINQEIEKAAVKIQEQGEVWLRERYEMTDLDGDGFIRDENGDVIYAIGKMANGDLVILQPDGEDKWKPAVNPYIDPEYKPALFDVNNLNRIDEGLRGSLEKGRGGVSFDEAFELNDVQRWLNGGWSDSTFGAQIDMAVPEGFWVEAGDDGKPKRTNSDSGYRFNPKPFEQVESELGTEPRWGQKPPETDEEREKWVFVKVTDLKVKSEEVRPINGREVDGGYVHFIFEDKDGNTIMRIRVQGVQTTSPSPLTSDGSNYIAATTVGVAVNGGVLKDDLGTEHLTHSSRISYLNLDATSLQMTGKVLPANIFDTDSIRDFYEELGIPTGMDDYGNFNTVDIPENSDYETYSEEGLRRRAMRAAGDTLMGGFLNPFGYVDLPGEEEEIDPEWRANENEMGGSFGMTSPRYNRNITNNRTLDTMAAYVPENIRERTGQVSGIAVTDIRGSIRGTVNGNDIIVVPKPNEDSLKEMLPFKADITPDDPAYGTFVDAGKGKNIVVSKGGDIFVKGATFFWREAAPDTDGDEIILDMTGVNQPGSGSNNNNKIFAHIGDGDPGLVQIANGDDVDDGTIHQDEESEIEALDSDGDGDADPLETLPDAQDDWFELKTHDYSFSHPAADAGGVGNVDAGLEEVIKTNINDAAEKIEEEVVRYNYENDTSLSRSAGDWQLSPMIEREDENWDAFFSEWEFFMDGETSDDMSLEGMQNE